MTKLPKLIAVLFIVSGCGKGPEPKMLPIDEAVSIKFDATALIPMDDNLKKFASKYDMDFISPIHKIEFSDGVKYVRALRRTGSASKFYCITIGNIKDSTELVVAFYKSACDVTGYEIMKNELTSMLKGL